MGIFKKAVSLVKDTVKLAANNNPVVAMANMAGKPLFPTSSFSNKKLGSLSNKISKGVGVISTVGLGVATGGISSQAIKKNQLDKSKLPSPPPPPVLGSSNTAKTPILDVPKLTSKLTDAKDLIKGVTSGNSSILDGILDKVGLKPTILDPPKKQPEKPLETIEKETSPVFYVGAALGLYALAKFFKIV
ncbi:hypothetical protein QWY31_00540 [Cytophagales bacterium LB-30]|uniref:Uncharacterized protein n=1 Tax=Shiella aurantiaca TaxID=3058365 RepID=A0ABT8F0K3_9BACT|nr:hypothetical protein [Shiella aurantiaca]MDN4163963.1 hypothetical protein [Shiella aurantiaca]